MRQGARKSIEESLRVSIEALGGLQEVGHLLKPEFDPVSAGQWLSHCLMPAKRDKLSMAQIALIFRRAHEFGKHEGFHALAAMLGYHVTAIEPRAQLDEITRRAEAAAHEAVVLSQEAVALARKISE